MIKVIITNEQVKALCEIFGKSPESLEEYEIGEMIDKAIDELYIYCK